MTVTTVARRHLRLGCALQVLLDLFSLSTLGV